MLIEPFNQIFEAPIRQGDRALSYSPEELALRDRFAESYSKSRAAVMRSIERSVCGCDYGGTSWTTREDASEMATLLDLGPAKRLLDVGAGSGWPALYMAELSGCDAILVDLPLEGMKVAFERAVSDGTQERCWTAVADASCLPLRNASVDAISHSDLLCCLQPKRATLAECRRVIGKGGRMVFTVISVTPRLSPDDHRRAVANGPEFVEADLSYPTLLAETGWAVLECRDITAAYADSCRRQLAADLAHKAELAEIIGSTEVENRLDSWRSKDRAIADGLLRRDMFVVLPR